MGGAARLMAVLTISSRPMRPSFLHLRCCISAFSSFPVLPLTFCSPIRTKPHPPQLSHALHSQPGNYPYGLSSSASERQQLPPQERGDHPWPQWSNFLHLLSSTVGLAAPEDGWFLPEDAFVAYEALPDDFVHAASLCLAFARARPNLLGSLSRRDIQAIVSNGTPFLFKSALDTARRMRAFLESDGTNVSEVNQADTVDLMKYILSYASNPTVAYERNGLYSRELVDSSIRNVLHELGTISCGTPTGYVPASHNQRVSLPVGHDIEMKRGDWICPKCKFMNFARNIKCLQCEEPRPKRQLAGGEWECPQCDFFNYGKNTVCLRCDCRRPGALLHNSLNSRLGLEYNREYSHGTITSSRSVVNEERASRWFGNNSQLNHAMNTNNAASEDKRNMQARVQEATISEVSDQKNISSETHGLGEKIQFSRNSANEMSAKGNKVEPAENHKRMMELHDAKDLHSTILDEEFPTMPTWKGENQFLVSKKKDRSLTSPKYKRQVAMDQANNTNFVPFVPFPPGYFGTKDSEKPSGSKSPVNAGDTSSIKSAAETERVNDSRHGVADPSSMQSKDDRHMSSANSRFSVGITPPPPEGPVQSSSTTCTSDSNAGAVQYSTKENANQAQFPESKNIQVSWTGKSLEGSSVREPDPLDMSEEAKAERWFRRVAQIKDISELSQIPNEDFPSIMPMRKGVNRFVVSKRKTPLERRLTSQQYKRNVSVVRTDPVKREDDNS